MNYLYSESYREDIGTFRAFAINSRCTRFGSLKDGRMGDGPRDEVRVPALHDGQGGTGKEGRCAEDARRYFSLSLDKILDKKFEPVKVFL